MPQGRAAADNEPVEVLDPAEFRRLPPVIYLPSTERVGPDDSHARLRKQQLPDGRWGLLAYTALDRLASGYGPEEPWVLAKSERLPALRDDVGFDAVVVDLPLRAPILDAEPPPVRVVTSEGFGTLPPMLYLPLPESVQHEQTEIRFDLRQTPDGRWALFVYTALDRLRACLGKDTPWITMPTPHLVRAQDDIGFDILMTDTPVRQILAEPETEGDNGRH